MSEPEKKKLSNERMLAGEVVSDKMEKTIVVKVSRTIKHPLVGKMIARSKKYKAHDEKNEAKVGDWVEMREGKPLSKTKHMVLSQILRKAK